MSRSDGFKEGSRQAADADDAVLSVEMNDPANASSMEEVKRLYLKYVLKASKANAGAPYHEIVKDVPDHVLAALVGEADTHVMIVADKMRAVIGKLKSTERDQKGEKIQDLPTETEPDDNNGPQTNAGETSQAPPPPPVDPPSYSTEIVSFDSDSSNALDYSELDSEGFKNRLKEFLPQNARAKDLPLKKMVQKASMALHPDRAKHRGNSSQEVTDQKADELKKINETMARLSGQ